VSWGHTVDDDVSTHEPGGVHHFGKSNDEQLL